jgi:TonB family protein
MRLVWALIIFASMASTHAQDSAISPQHMELPSGYPNVARLARLQGTITVKLTISGDGEVVAAEATSSDDLLRAHPQLQREAEKLSRRWKFICLTCAKDSTHPYALVFSYKLEGKDSQYADTHIAVDWPNRVTVTANPPLANPD